MTIPEKSAINSLECKRHETPSCSFTQSAIILLTEAQYPTKLYLLPYISTCTVHASGNKVQKKYVQDKILFIYIEKYRTKFILYPKVQDNFCLCPNMSGDDVYKFFYQNDQICIHLKGLFLLCQDSNSSNKCILFLSVGGFQNKITLLKNRNKDTFILFQTSDSSIQVK